MNSIVYVGMDVHKESYTVCCYSFDTDEVMYKQKMPGDYKLICFAIFALHKVVKFWKGHGNEYEDKESRNKKSKYNIVFAFCSHLYNRM